MQLAHNNRVLAPDVDTVFFMTSVENGYVSSSLVKEIASFGGDVFDGPGVPPSTGPGGGRGANPRGRVGAPLTSGAGVPYLEPA